VFNGYFFNVHLPISFGYVGYVHKFVELDVVTFVNVTDMYSVRIFTLLQAVFVELYTRQT
jgi:hypothetical protein